MSHLSGRITLSTEVDSVADYSGFQIMVAQQRGNIVDTLAFSETNETGDFSMDISAPRSDIYALVLARDGAVLRVDEIAIAQDDSATLNMQFPFGNRPVMVRSRENAALLGFRNTMSLYEMEIKKLALSEGATREDYQNLITQTTELLWTLRESDPDAIVADIASARSILLLEGWNDSLVVARTRLMNPNASSFPSVLGTARRAQIQLGGMESSITLLSELKSAVTDPDNLAALQSELVLAYRDNNQLEQALDAARELKMEYATDSTWIQWADNAIYDLENLATGMPAPAFDARDTEGNALNLDSFKGRYVVFEFYAPGRQFEQELFLRNEAYRAGGDTPAFDILSFSLQADTLLNEAFLEGRDIPGRHVFLPDGGDAKILDAYNVHVLPTRFLIDPESKIVGKYVMNNGILAFQRRDHVLQLQTRLCLNGLNSSRQNHALNLIQKLLVATKKFQKLPTRTLKLI